MKKTVFILTAIITLVLSVYSVSADEYSSALSEIGGGHLTENLDKATIEALDALGIEENSYQSIVDLSLSDVVKLVLNTAGTEGTAPIASSALMLCLIIIYAVFDNFRDNLRSGNMQGIAHAVFVLAITISISNPVISVINRAVNSIEAAGNFMLLYIPIMIAVLVTNGQTITSASYYSLVVMAGEGITWLSANLISPLLRVFLGISITSAVSGEINLRGIADLLSRFIKWSAAFMMTSFTGLLTFKTLITTSADTLSTKAVRFTLSSFIPIVGSALAEAYKTIQGSMNLLKTGLGVFVIISIILVFLPVVINCMLWVISLNVTKSISDLLGVGEPASILEGCSAVLSTLLAIILCTMAVYVISTAVIITMGKPV